MKAVAAVERERVRPQLDLMLVGHGEVEQHKPPPRGETVLLLTTLEFDAAATAEGAPPLRRRNIVSCGLSIILEKDVVKFIRFQRFVRTTLKLCLVPTHWNTVHHLTVTAAEVPERASIDEQSLSVF